MLLAVQYLSDSEAPLAADLPATLDALVAPPPGRLAQVVHHRLQQVHEEHCPENSRPVHGTRAGADKQVTDFNRTRDTKQENVTGKC